MEAALLNVRITYQKNTIIEDAIGNHKNEWKDEYSCYATVSGEGGTETQTAGTTVDHADIAFTVRYCKKASVITTDGYRVLFNGEIYNILSIDHMNYKRRSIKFRCEKVRR